MLYAVFVCLLVVCVRCIVVRCFRVRKDSLGWIPRCDSGPVEAVFCIIACDIHFSLTFL